METPAPPSPGKTGTTPNPAPPEHHDLESSSEFSNFFSDIKIFWEKFGTPVVGVVAVAAIVFAGYNFFTQRADQARQNAWLDLYGSTTPESLELVVDSTKSPAVRAAANLRAGDLLLAESRTANEADAAAILDTAAERYQAALDDAPHVIFELNALDGLGVVAESQYDTNKARGFYEQVKSTAGEAYPYWSQLADRRLALLPELAEPVVFAPEAVGEEQTAAEPGDSGEVESDSETPAEVEAVEESTGDAPADESSE